MQIRQRSGSSAVDGFLKKTGKEWADNNFDRYFRNEVKSKKPLLDEQAVRGRERKIMDHAASIVKAFTAEHKDEILCLSVRFRIENSVSIALKKNRTPAAPR